MIQNILTDREGNLLVWSLRERYEHLNEVLYGEFYTQTEPSFTEEFDELEALLELTNVEEAEILYTEACAKDRFRENQEEAMTTQLLAQLSEYINWNNLTEDLLSNFTTVDVNGETYYIL